MELIYTDADKKDIGVINAASFDLAFGVDENDFKLEIPKINHCCVPGSVIYVEGEEYGGIVDGIETSSSDELLTYTGRTFHGILNSKIIQPPSGCDYLTLYGDANEVISEIITLLDLTDLFVAETVPSGIEITAYDMDRYIKGYDGIRKMLNSVSAKLKMKWQGRYVKLYAEPLIDYSVNEEFLLSAVTDMSIKKTYNPVNHMIGLGSGDLSERKVIHIFTDENGGVMPYAEKDSPIKDSDYILDVRNQQLFGKAEVCEVYDLSNAETVENYVLTTAQPKDWAKNFADYYVLDDDDKFKQMSPETENVYTLQSAKPSDWNNGFSNYFVKNGADYQSVQGVEKVSYRRVSSRPKDWSNNYGEYFYYYSDGVTAEYKSFSGVTRYSYKKQTKKPSDWRESYNSYYVKDKKGKFASVKNYTVWKANRFYTKYSNTVAPKWNSNCYKKSVSSSAPVWKASTYYTQSSKNIKPVWKSNTYYKQELDNYASIVKGCLERLEKAWNSDDIDITLNPDRNYDIGDIVGGIDPITGISAARQITKKIVKRNYDGIYEISYEEGTSI